MGGRSGGWGSVFVSDGGVMPVAIGQCGEMFVAAKCCFLDDVFNLARILDICTFSTWRGGAGRGGVVMVFAAT
jgi:hypothetical protein